MWVKLPHTAGFVTVNSKMVAYIRPSDSSPYQCGVILTGVVGFVLVLESAEAVVKKLEEAEAFDRKQKAEDLIQDLKSGRVDGHRPEADHAE